MNFEQWYQSRFDHKDPYSENIAKTAWNAAIEEISKQDTKSMQYDQGFLDGLGHAKAAVEMMINMKVDS